jgi:hypothetical protein
MKYQNGLVKVKTFVGSSSRRVSTGIALLSCAVFLAAHGSALSAMGQERVPTAAPQTAAKPPVKKKYTLRITKEGITGVSLKADKATLAEIGADLSKQLGVKVIIGASLAKEAISVEFADLTLEPAMRLLAPRVLMDYEYRAGAQPTPLGVYLLGPGDPDPLANAVVEASSQAMLISGNTEDTGVTTDDDPLRVDFDDEDNHITIKSKKQPLAAVLLTIADVLGVPADLKYDGDEIIDTEIKDVLFEDAITRLSPNIRVYVRDDLTRSRRIPLRLTLLRPDAKVASQ